MVRVDEYKEIVNYISSSYNYMDKTPYKEFLETEEIAVKLTISGLTRKGAAELKEALDHLGISKRTE